MIWERWSIIFCSFFCIWIFSLIIKFYFIFSKNNLWRNGERFWTLLGWVRAQFTRGQSGLSISSALLFQIVFELSVLSKNKFEKIMILFFDWFLMREKYTARIYCLDLQYWAFFVKMTHFNFPRTHGRTAGYLEWKNYFNSESSKSDNI